MKTKTLNKWLREQSLLLPKEQYEAFHKYNQPRYQDIEENGDVVEHKGSVIGEVEKHPVNHYRRLKAAFKSQGWDGVHKYFYLRGYMLKREDENKE